MVEVGSRIGTSEERAASGVIYGLAGWYHQNTYRRNSLTAADSCNKSSPVTNGRGSLAGSQGFPAKLLQGRAQCTLALSSNQAQGRPARPLLMTKHTTTHLGTKCFVGVPSPDPKALPRHARCNFVPAGFTVELRSANAGRVRGRERSASRTLERLRAPWKSASFPQLPGLPKQGLSQCRIIDSHVSGRFRKPTDRTTQQRWYPNRA